MIIPRALSALSFITVLCFVQTNPVFGNFKKKEVKVVLVSLFEVGEVSGDHPGEFQFWKERLPLDEKLPLPHGNKDLYWNEEMGVLGMVTGIGTAKSAASVMAVGLDPRFDLSKAYWLLAGIAGFDPNDASLASACWIDYVVDGDLGHTIDIREAPEDWETGKFPFRSVEPYPKERPENSGSAFHLNEELTDWAFELTKEIDLPDAEVLATRRDFYKGYTNAQKAPFVLIGSYLAAMNYWHGKTENDWANSWVDYWTGGEGEFVASAMEGSGMMTSIEMLAKAGLVDRNRVLMLRTASNFTMQWPGGTAAESIRGEKAGSYSAFIPSLETAYSVGSVVVRAISNDWENLKDNLPGTP